MARVFEFGELGSLSQDELVIIVKCLIEHRQDLAAAKAYSEELLKREISGALIKRIATKFQKQIASEIQAQERQIKDCDMFWRSNRIATLQKLFMAATKTESGELEDCSISKIEKGLDIIKQLRVECDSAAKLSIDRLKLTGSPADSDDSSGGILPFDNGLREKH